MLSEENSPQNKSKIIREIFACVKYKRIQKWSIEEDKILLELAEKYNYRMWNKISKAFTNKTTAQCYERYRKIKPELKKGPWTVEEDEILKELISVYGKKWSKISRIMKSRTGKQIRDRYLNNLDNSYNKKKFTDEEEKMILHLLSKFGPIWSLIALHFPDRNSQLIKNRFNYKFYSNLISINPNSSKEEFLDELKMFLN